MVQAKLLEEQVIVHCRHRRNSTCHYTYEPCLRTTIIIAIQRVTNVIICRVDFIIVCIAHQLKLTQVQILDLDVHSYLCAGVCRGHASTCRRNLTRTVW